MRFHHVFWLLSGFLESNITGFLQTSCGIHGKSPCRRRWSILRCVSPPQILGSFLNTFVCRRTKIWAFLRSFAHRHLKNWISVGDPCMDRQSFLYLNRREGIFISLYGFCWLNIEIYEVNGHISTFYMLSRAICSIPPPPTC